MLSYRHAFHAGNHADVLKHVVFVNVLLALQRKPAPLCCIDTHAGLGRYALDSPEALRLGEFREGIARLWRASAPPAAIAPYLELVRAANDGPDLRHYPGSPALAAALRRPTDRLVLIERHPADHARLAQRFGGVRHCRVEAGDGYALLRAHVPPREKRGVVLIDPSWELRDEARLLLDSVTDAHRRWATGVYLVWYPLLARAEADRLLRRFTDTGIRRQLSIELALRAPEVDRGMWGSGVIVINPPFGLEPAIAEALPWLARRLGAAADARQVVDWLVPE
ncbi:MAG: 23S rRNA (adenine(2030)-N(6))-methyltransferase RlmJ [Gammaproteobacteria bacterium]